LKDSKQGRIKIVWGPWLKLRKGPLSIYIYEKLNERIEVLVLLKQMKLEQKNESLTSVNHNMNGTHGFSKQYNVRINEIISFHLRVVFVYVTWIFFERFQKQSG